MNVRMKMMMMVYFCLEMLNLVKCFFRSLRITDRALFKSIEEVEEMNEWSVEMRFFFCRLVQQKFGNNLRKDSH